ncbi:MAG TPA: histidine phosphatase family protein [Streptosporangiaceae bacterium]|nr:histidine phosphatase family protein [Streptosporangiaceae bacterium]
MVRIVLWRHGRTSWNAQRRFQGHSDVPLDHAGHAQARDAAPYLAAMRPAAIFSSDLARAAGTASYLAELTGLAVHLDKDLRERGGGAWEGLTDAEIRAGYPQAYATFVPPDGEPVDSVADRVGAAITRIADGLREAAPLAVLVSHGAAINLGMARLLGLPTELRLLGPLGNCSWSVVGRRAGRWRLLEHNVGRLPDLAPESVPVLAAGPEEEALPGAAPGREN